MTFNSLFRSLLAAYACGATGSYTHEIEGARLPD
jgi:hypothetical protein